MNLDDFLHSELADKNIGLTEFSELLIRLLDYGAINRDESQVEAALYDRYVQCESIVEAYLSVLKIRLLHNRRFQYIRVFPPGAEVPGLPDDDHSPFNQGLRVRPSQQEVAIILVLRIEYEKSLREGLVNEKGYVTLPLESLAIGLKNVLKRTLPEAINERRQLFKRLKQLRLIQFNGELDLDSPDTWISIHPSITTFVNDEALAELYPEDIESKHTQKDSSDVL